jgi:hypothetical protein
LSNCTAFGHVHVVSTDNQIFQGAPLAMSSGAQ